MLSHSYTMSLVCSILYAGFHFSLSAPLTGYPFNDIKPISRAPIKSPGQGGESGDPFDDVAAFNESGNLLLTGIRSINISYGDVIESIQVVYILANDSLYQTPNRGKPSSQFVEIHLDNIEHVALIEGMTDGTNINELTITTLGPDYERKVYGPFGKPAPTKFEIPGYVIGFHGRSSTNSLSNLGVYILDELKKSEQFGPGKGGSPFDEETDINVPPIIRLSSITLWHGDFINGIQSEFLLLGGSKLLGEVHGGQNASLTTTITLDDEEVIEQVELRSSDDDGAYISMITFTARKKDGKSEVFGPFGRKGEQTYTLNGNIFGFYGHAGAYIDRLGFYYI